MTRRQRSRKVYSVILGAVLLIASGSWFWLKSVESRRWSRMHERVAQLRREADARCGARPVLRGTAVPGDAWEDYFKAIDFSDEGFDFSAIRKYGSVLPGADRGRAEAVLAGFGTHLEQMRQGTRRAEARRTRIHEGERPFELGVGTRLSRAGMLSAMAVCRARVLQEDGKVPEAAELLLDLGQFGEDIGRDGSAIADLSGRLILSQALRGLKELISTSTLSIERLQQIDRELRQLDAGLPSTDTAVLGELEFHGSLLVKDEYFGYFFKVGKPPPVVRPGWRHLFSWPLMKASWFELADHCAAELRDGDQIPYVLEQSRWTSVCKECEGDKNFFAGIFISSIQGRRVRRQDLTHLRLLRAAVHYYATGEFLDLKDPFGTKLHYAEAENGLRIWGVGMNGIDDGGRGGWAYPVLADIVLEIPRRP